MNMKGNNIDFLRSIRNRNVFLIVRVTYYTQISQHFSNIRLRVS